MPRPTKETPADVYNIFEAQQQQQRVRGKETNEKDREFHK